MNMGTNTLTREQLNEAIEQFADKIMEALGATVSDEEASEPELTGTYFKAIDTDGVEVEVDAADMQSGALIILDYAEYFHSRLAWEGDWMSYSGEWYTNEEFAEKMRNHPALPTVVHCG